MFLTLMAYQLLFAPPDDRTLRMMGVLSFGCQSTVQVTKALQLWQVSQKPPQMGGVRFRTTVLPQLGQVSDTIILFFNFRWYFYASTLTVKANAILYLLNAISHLIFFFIGQCVL